MSEPRIVDADCHILEPPDIWTNWLPEKYADKAPKLVKDHEGGDAWLTAVGGEPDPIGLVATPGMPFDEFRWFGVTYEEARTGCYNGAARLEDMDIDGVLRGAALPAAAHDEPLPRRRRRRLRARGRRGVQQLPVRGVLRAGPEAAHRRGADPVTRHRHVDRRAAQGEGARREGRASSRTGRPAARPSRPTTTRSGPPRSTRACPSRSTSTSSAAQQRAAGRKAAGEERQRAATT